MTTNQQLDKLCMEHFGNRKYVADGIFHESAESRWEMEKPKVLFVMKQPNSNNLLGEDYRTYELHDVLLGNQNWEQLFARLYGIIHTTAQGYPSYEEATRQESMIEAFTQHAFAMINIDKEHGFGTTDTAELKRYAQENASLIRRQIEILAPDIIVCCGQGVFDIVNSIMQPAAPTSSNWTKYNKVLGILYFDTYHPGKPMAGQRLIDAYEMPLMEYIKTLNNNNMYSKELEELIRAAFVDGVLTAKEREILKKRAAKEGIDPDEFDLYLDSKVQEIDIENEQKLLDQLKQENDHQGFEPKIAPVMQTGSRFEHQGKDNRTKEIIEEANEISEGIAPKGTEAEISNGWLRYLVTILMFAFIVVGIIFAINFVVPKKEVNPIEIIQNINKSPMLYTVEATAEILISKSGDEWYKLGNRHIIIPVTANLKAGINLSTIGEGDLQIDGNVVKLTLPDPIVEMESSKIIYDDIIEVKDGVFRDDFSPEEKSELAAQASDSIKSNLLRYDLIEPAQEQAKLFLRNMLNSLGYELECNVPKYDNEGITKFFRK